MNCIYDREAAVDYAKEWALRKNPRFKLADSGRAGDSAGFVSQCLYSGAGVMNNSLRNGWYYENKLSHSKSWNNAEALLMFLLKNKKSGPRAMRVTKNEISPGDVVHIIGRNNSILSAAFVASTHNKRILICAHDFNAYMRPLDSYDYRELIYLHICGVGI